MIVPSVSVRSCALLFVLASAAGLLALYGLDGNFRQSADLRRQLEGIRGGMVRGERWMTESVVEADKERRRAIRQVCPSCK